jgi:hypothetical protein
MMELVFSIAQLELILPKDNANLAMTVAKNVLEQDNATIVKKTTSYLTISALENAQDSTMENVAQEDVSNVMLHVSSVETKQITDVDYALRDSLIRINIVLVLQIFLMDTIMIQRQEKL